MVGGWTGGGWLDWWWVVGLVGVVEQLKANNS